MLAPASKHARAGRIGRARRCDAGLQWTRSVRPRGNRLGAATVEETSPPRKANGLIASLLSLPGRRSAAAPRPAARTAPADCSTWRLPRPSAYASEDHSCPAGTIDVDRRSAKEASKLVDERRRVRAGNRGPASAFADAAQAEEDDDASVAAAARSAATGGPTLYAALACAPDATGHALRRAYRRLALKHHPDRAADREAAADAMAALNAAYEVLADEGRRRRYDAALAALRREGMGLKNLSKEVDSGKYVCGVR